jgi:nitrous oxide reductase accessory protein NosL
MKKTLFSAIVMALVLVSCNQKNKETTTDNPHMLDNDSTMIDNDSTMMSNDSTMTNNKTKMMNNQKKMYACPMHPEVQGKLNDKCPKCGMKLTEPVPEKTEENK